MALLAVLNHGDSSWNGNYAQIEFHSYNERYEGSYPNLYFYFDVQARIVAINSGWWMIQANTTFNYGGAQQTHSIYTGKVYGTSDWYFVGSHRKQCECGRSFKFEDDCSVSGYPNLSGRGSITSPTIEAPAFTARAENIDQRTCDIVWDTTDNPYNMYRMYVKYPDGHYSSQLPMDGSYSLEGLNSNTSYTYRVEAWQADGRGSAVAAKDVTFKTLENYPEISVTEVTYEIEDAGETDNVTFRFKSTDDSHVSKWHYQIQGGPPFSGTSSTYSESRLAKNLESYIDVWTEDTLGRTSSKFRQYFHTTFTKMTVWRRMKTNGYQLFDASKLPTKSQDGVTVTNNNDGSFTISGNGKLTESFNNMYFNYTKEETKKMLKVGTLYGKIEMMTRPAVGFLVYSNGRWKELNIDENTSVSMEVTDDMLNANDLWSRIRFYGHTGFSIKPGTIKPMFYQEGDGTWEPYTGGKPFDGYLRGFMYCIQNMLWGYARPYILNTGRKWLNALPYDIVRRFVFSGKTNTAGLEVHKIYGNTVQETTKGINLANYNSKGNNVNVGDVKTGKKYTFFFNQEYESGFNLRIVVSGQQYKLELDKKDISALARAVFTADRDGALYYNGYTDASNSKNFMLVEGDVYDNVSSIQYEPYTGGKPAPNSDYPMPIKNVEISKIESVGKNLLEDSGYNYSSDYNFTYSKHKIPEIFKSLKPDTTYTAFIYGIDYIYGTFLICDNNHRNININGAITISNKNKVVFTTLTKLNPIENNVVYIGKNLSAEEMAKIPDLKIMIVEGDHSSEDLEYQDFQGYSAVETSLILAKNDVYSKRTILRKRKKIVFDGSSDEAWNLQSINNYGLANFSIFLSPMSNDNTQTVLSNRFKRQNSLIANTTEEGIYLNNVSYLFIRIDKNRLSTQDVSGFRTWLSIHNTVVEYELASPTTEYVTIPTITSFDSYTNAWTDSEVETQIEWRPAASSTLSERFYAVEQYRKVLNENT